MRSSVVTSNPTLNDKEPNSRSEQSNEKNGWNSNNNSTLDSFMTDPLNSITSNGTNPNTANYHNVPPSNNQLVQPSDWNLLPPPSSSSSLSLTTTLSSTTLSRPSLQTRSSFSLPSILGQIGTSSSDQKELTTPTASHSLSSFSVSSLSTGGSGGSRSTSRERRGSDFFFGNASYNPTLESIATSPFSGDDRTYWDFGMDLDGSGGELKDQDGQMGVESGNQSVKIEQQQQDPEEIQRPSLLNPFVDSSSQLNHSASNSQPLSEPQLDSTIESTTPKAVDRDEFQTTSDPIPQAFNPRAKNPRKLRLKSAPLEGGSKRKASEMEDGYPKSATCDTNASSESQFSESPEPQSAEIGLDEGRARRYPCSFKDCGKTFSTSGHCARHFRIHSGNKPYRCTFPDCSNRFERRDNGISHYKTHLQTEKEKLSPKEKSELKNYVLDALKKGIALEVMSSRPSEDDRPKKGIRKGKGISETVKPKATGRGNVKGKGRQSSGATMTRSRSASVSLKPSESRNSSLDDGPSPSSSTDLPFKKPKLSPFSEPPTSEPSIFLDQDGSNLHELNHQIHENNRKRSKTFSLSLPPVRNSKTKPNTLESYRQGFADNAKNVIVEILRKNPGVGDIVPKKVGIKEAEKELEREKEDARFSFKAFEDEAGFNNDINSFSRTSNWSNSSFGSSMSTSTSNSNFTDGSLSLVDTLPSTSNQGMGQANQYDPKVEELRLQRFNDAFTNAFGDGLDLPF